jgi:hypothetical protein
MQALRRAIAVVGCSVLVGGIAHAQENWLKGSTEQQLKTLSDIQPGLGTVMIEYSYRFGTLYYAAKGGNWSLAAYQLKEMREIQEVGETTRPPRAEPLKAFESAYLDPLAKAIEAKDAKKFGTAFKATEQACNGCHAAAGFGYIKYQLPKASPSPLSNTP